MWVTVTVEFAGMQAPGMDGGFVVCVMTVLLVEPLAGENAPVKPAAVHFARAAPPVKPSRVGTKRQVGGVAVGVGVGVGVGAGVAAGGGVGVGVGVGVGEGVGMGVGAGLGVIEPLLIVMPAVHGHQVPDWRLCPATV